jgi:hypothetical protein
MLLLKQPNLIHNMSSSQGHSQVQGHGQGNLVPFLTDDDIDALCWDDSPISDFSELDSTWSPHSGFSDIGGAFVSSSPGDRGSIMIDSSVNHHHYHHYHHHQFRQQEQPVYYYEDAMTPVFPTVTTDPHDAWHQRPSHVQLQFPVTSPDVSQQQHFFGSGRDEAVIDSSFCTSSSLSPPPYFPHPSDGALYSPTPQYVAVTTENTADYDPHISLTSYDFPTTASSSNSSSSSSINTASSTAASLPRQQQRLASIKQKRRGVRGGPGGKRMPPPLIPLHTYLHHHNRRSPPHHKVRQRRAANLRERKRMKTINDAFDCLRERIPVAGGPDRKLSKVLCSVIVVLFD